MTMPILRLGLMLGTLGFGYVSWASTSAGFPIEIALVRGTLAFMGLSFLAYLGELVVATAPRVEAEADAQAEDGEEQDDEPEDDADDNEAASDDADDGAMSDAERLAALIRMPPPDSNDDEQQAA